MRGGGVREGRGYPRGCEEGVGGCKVGVEGKGDVRERVKGGEWGSRAVGRCVGGLGWVLGREGVQGTRRGCQGLEGSEQGRGAWVTPRIRWGAGARCRGRVWDAGASASTIPGAIWGRSGCGGSASALEPWPGASLQLTGHAAARSSSRLGVASSLL